MPALLIEGAKLIVPTEAGEPLDRTVAANFERFDGLAPLDAPSSREQTDFYPAGPRPGMSAPTAHTYTPGAIPGLTNTLGGQPLPVGHWLYNREVGYTPANWQQMQWRLGSGQNFQGVAQTVQMGEVTNNPPQPDPLASILAGWG